ncbi:restriction endonuclease [Priestia endophytica]|nr:restriction endonuclease [Priestia endophytica]
MQENDGELVELTLDIVKKEALNFCNYQEKVQVPHLYGSNDGKAVGTYIEHEFKKFIAKKYSFQNGNSARGIDLPGEEILTDIKVTSIKQPQSSCPFKSARQKVYGLGYNLLLFVYKKNDDPANQTASFEFVSCAFIDKERTADFQTTKQINDILNNEGNIDDLFAFFEDKNIPGDEIVHTQLAEEILSNPPKQGYLTISNALQWRLQYKRIVDMPQSIEGIDKII